MVHDNDHFLHQIPTKENQLPIKEQIQLDFSILTELPLPFSKLKVALLFYRLDQKAQNHVPGLAPVFLAQFSKSS
jgi:hypothetical protein